MCIAELLQQNKHETDEVLLGMIPSNRINHGSAEGGLVSAKQFHTLVADLIAWREATASAKPRVSPKMS